MKKITLKTFLILFLTFISTTGQTQTYSFGPYNADMLAQVWYNYNYSPLYEGNLVSGLGNVVLGMDYHYKTYRAVFQWDLSNLNIPAGAEFKELKIVYQYAYKEASSDLGLNIYALDNSLDSSPIDWTYLFGGMELNSNSGTYLDEAWGSPNQLLTKTIPASTNSCGDFVAQAVQNNKLVIGFRSSYDDINASANRTYHFESDHVTLELVYDLPVQDVTVQQKYSNGVQFGNVGHYVNGSFVNAPSNTTYSFNIGNTESFQAETIINSNEKFNRWNSNLSYKNYLDLEISEDLSTLAANFKSVTNSYVKNHLEHLIIPSTGSIQLKNPWYRDSTGAKGTLNRGLDAIYHSQSSFDLTTGSNFQGVFLGEGYSDPTKPYYSVKAVSPQPIAVNNTNHTFYFQNWEAYPSGSATFQNANAAETPVVFNSSGAEVRAVMKGTALTDEETSLNNSGQRKVAMDGYGNLYRVYESMNNVWLERSTDNGANWSLLNDGKPLNNTSLYTASSPSIEIDNYNAVKYYITNQENYNVSSSQIRIMYYSGTTRILFEIVPFSEINYNASHPDMKPVVAKNYRQHLMVGYSVPNSNEEGDEGLFYRYGRHLSGEYSITWFGTSGAPDKIPGTTMYSTSPALDINPTSQTDPFHLAWQEGTTSIKYLQLNQINNQSEISFTNAYTPSTGGSYTSNYNPSLVAMNDNSVRISWIGAKKVDTGTASKVSDLVWEKKAVLRARQYTGTWNSVFWKFSDDVVSQSLNRTSDGTIGNYALSMISLTNGTYYTKNITNYSFTLQSKGTGVTSTQLSNANALTNMYCYGTKDVSTAPFEIAKQGPMMATSKTNTLVNHGGREGIISSEKGEFSFAIGDILLNDTFIDFVELPEEDLVIDDVNTMNSVLETNSFQLRDNDNLVYSIQYGVINEETAAQLLGDGFVNFKLQLVDVSDNSVLGEFDNVTYNKENLSQYKNVSYQVDASGIDNKTVKFRLVVNTNIEAEKTIANIVSDSDIIRKINYQTVSFMGSMEVKDYGLAQNYPNPFNLTTTIQYAVKAPGMVTLKIYNTLGEEIKTLVNTAQQKGRYEVQFNASNFASGVYIYRLQVNDPSSGSGQVFTATKKSMLLK